MKSKINNIEFGIFQIVSPNTSGQGNCYTSQFWSHFLIDTLQDYGWTYSHSVIIRGGYTNKGNVPFPKDKICHCWKNNLNKFYTDKERVISFYQYENGKSINGFSSKILGNSREYTYSAKKRGDLVDILKKHLKYINRRYLVWNWWNTKNAAILAPGELNAPVAFQLKRVSWKSLLIDFSGANQNKVSKAI